MKSLDMASRRILSSAAKLIAVATVLGVVALLTDEPAAVAGALATTVAALYYRPAGRCLSR